MRHAVFRRGAFQAHKVSISITEGEFQSLDLSGEFHCNSRCELLACFLDSNSYRYGHTNHGVVTCANETHHLFELGVLEGLQSGETFRKVLLYKTWEAFEP